MEWLHFRWFFAWPWLTLGNVFGNNTFIVQWYQYTGVIGGSFWILICNAAIYKKIKIKYIFYIIFFPISLSIFLYYFKLNQLKKQSLSNTIDIVLTQPYINRTKYDTDRKLMKSLLENASNSIPKNEDPDLIIFPELTLNDCYWKENIKENDTYLDIRKFLSEKHPLSSVIIGAKMRAFTKDSTENNKIYGHSYKNYNVALCINNNGKLSIKPKKKFIPKTEYWPSYLNKFLPDSNSCNYSTTEDSDFFVAKKNTYFLTICYESIFSNFCNKSKKENTELIIVLASEVFLNNNLDAMNQYLNICKLRSIENNKYLAKSSNHGISAIINPLGEIVYQMDATKSEYKFFKIPINCN
jgi:apolipoprotein N-acyltransferase